MYFITGLRLKIHWVKIHGTSRVEVKFPWVKIHETSRVEVKFMFCIEALEHRNFHTLVIPYSYITFCFLRTHHGLIINLGKEKIPLSKLIMLISGAGA